jgi:UDP-N-acetylglucosamine diphosphorylase / glucose-1-phosphate thymidylyltransferase / UDP-N-acetylgalactosamine diphosphorylase / glucosamine-1-phosphate N-acetyltransferase / galactosamine-1-phosphate N-acetyltransferase
MSPPRVGVIAAAGAGRRIRPHSIEMPKVLLNVGGKALLTRQLELLRDAFGIVRVLVVVCHGADLIRRKYRDDLVHGITIEFVENADVEGGLGTVLVAVERHVQEPFVLLLGDELYLESNHAALATIEEQYVAICGIYPVNDFEVIRKNYGVTLACGRITSLVEKPLTMSTPFTGCGTYVLQPEIFHDLRATSRSVRTGRLELTDILDHAARRGAPVLPFVLSGRYVNVNTPEDLRIADELCASPPAALRTPASPSWLSGRGDGSLGPFQDNF